MISVILPTFNEVKTGWIEKILNNLSSIEDIEVIVVDGGSTDGTLEIVKKYPFKIVCDNSNNRAGRINTGIESAQSSMVLIHHPRSLLEPAGIIFLNKRQKEFSWGGFHHSFDRAHYLLKFTSWYSNNIRAKLREIIYLDHCLFFNKNLLNERRPFSEVEIFEDTLMSLKLKTVSPATLLPFPSTTSSIRFFKNGVWKQALLNQWLKLKFLKGSSPSKMNQVYERNLNLNNQYNSN